MVQKVNELERPVPVRIKFEKVGRLQYISHLDLNRTFSHALVRAKIPVWYTMGFNPHTKMNFATPLSVGSESLCEYLDIKIVKDVSAEFIMTALKENLADGLNVVDVYFPETKFDALAWSEYEIKLLFADASVEYAKKISDIFARDEVIVTKRSKSGDKDVNIKSYLNRLDVAFENGEIVMRTVLSCGKDNFLNPEYLIKVIKDELGILGGDPTKEGYSVIRKEVYFDDAVTAFR